MHFQASDNKGHNFLNLCNDKMQTITLSIAKGGLWLKYFGHLNTLCIRTIVNYAPIGEYQLRFFPKENFECLYGSYLIELRQYIFHECRRYNNYWNPRRDSIAHFILFLEFNNSAFSFKDSITKIVLCSWIALSFF